MQLVDLVFILLGYLFGSIPFGLIYVKIGTGKDVRQIASGRTGGTNAYRAAGLWAGILTGVSDGFKGAIPIWIAKGLGHSDPLVLILIGIAAILGHNYSIFLAERDENGKIRLRGGAGGATVVGGAAGLWFPSVFFTVGGGILVLFLTGYASVITMSAALVTTIVFLVRALMGIDPWTYVLYGILAEIILVWALRPNIKRLLEGTERMVGPRAKRLAAKQARAEAQNKNQQ
jgi:glycerol-3-phosphate acyltransferase PlsY